MSQNLKPATASKKRKGGQPGNQNARKHGFYSRAITRDDLRRIKQASGIRGSDDEIALNRVIMQNILENNPHDFPLILRCLAILCRYINNRELGKKFAEGGMSQVLSALLAATTPPVPCPDNSSHIPLEESDAPGSN
jgi:hypothetical protein